MPIIRQKFIRRGDLHDNPTHLYVFGDNLIRAGYGGQAAEMRGELNAFGIPTKRSPSEYLSDQLDFLTLAAQYTYLFTRLATCINNHQTIVWPFDNIGTGLAQMESRAPACWDLLQAHIRFLEGLPNA